MTSASSAAVADPPTGDDHAGNKLCEDELLIIFANNNLDTSDLLNFRRVSRSWRDAATRILLKRNSCQLILDVRFMESPPGSTRDLYYKGGDERKMYCNARDRTTSLKDLNNLLRTSREFPSTSFRFINSTGTRCAGTDCLSVDEIEMVKLFDYYGCSIESICFGECVSKTCLQDLLVYSSNLKFLDLSYVTSFLTISDQTLKKGGLKDVSPTSSFCLPIKTLRLSTYPDPSVFRGLAFLLRASPELTSIENVSETNLALVIREGKTHLIKELKLNPFFADIPEIQKLAMKDTSPKLFKLSVNFSNIREHSQQFAQFVVVLNRIIASSKDTLECFDIKINPINFPFPIKIPQLQNLKRVVLTQDVHCYWISGIDNDVTFEFEKLTDGKKYIFPLLHTVVLNVPNYNSNEYMSLFCNHRQYGEGNEAEVADNNEHSIPSVDTLDIRNSDLPTMSEAVLISKVFPNITTLKFACVDSRGLKNSMWEMFPLVESIHIYGILNSPDSDSNSHCSIIDSFFTGFPVSLCAKLQTQSTFPEFPACIQNYPETIQFLRTKPSICDLKRLRELKMTFLSLQRTFATKLSGVYGFQLLPHLKISFFCNPPSTSKYRNTEMRSIQRCLAPLAPYASLTMVSKFQSEFRLT